MRTGDKRGSGKTGEGMGNQIEGQQDLGKWECGWRMWDFEWGLRAVGPDKPFI